MAGGMHGGGMHGEGACVLGASMAGGGMHGGGMHDRGCARQERGPLQQVVCILLECILVHSVFGKFWPNKRLAPKPDAMRPCGITSFLYWDVPQLKIYSNSQKIIAIINFLKRQKCCQCWSQIPCVKYILLVLGKFPMFSQS